MADLAELLMFEHSSIRVVSREAKNDIAFDFFTGFNDYLVNDHVAVEEKILFPVIVDNDWADRQEFAKTVSRILADHKLIETLANNIIRWHESGNEDLYKRRMPDFFMILTDHNLSEEDQVFPRWKLVDETRRYGAIRDAIELIQSTDENNYFDKTGISAELIKYIAER